MESRQLKEPSKEFKEAIRSGGTSDITCGFCGRTYFVDDKTGYDWNNGEYESLVEKNRKEPDKYIFYQGNSIPWGYLAGKEYPIDCECNAGSQYEDFIWTHKNLISDFLRRKSQTLEKKAVEATRVAEEVANSISEETE